jgi:hypothetical protein
VETIKNMIIRDGNWKVGERSRSTESPLEQANRAFGKADKVYGTMVFLVSDSPIPKLTEIMVNDTKIRIFAKDFDKNSVNKSFKAEVITRKAPYICIDRSKLTGLSNTVNDPAEGTPNDPNPGDPVDPVLS